MDTPLQRALTFAVIACICTATTCFGQDSSVSASYPELRKQHGEALATGRTEQELAEVVAAWAEANDWSQLPVLDRCWLHDKLATADQVDPNHFSVRWTGQISAARDGEYVFAQQFVQRAYGGVLKLWINEQLVLDTTEVRARLGHGPELGPVKDDALSSVPVALAAGTPVSIRAEFVFNDEDPDFQDLNHQWRFPLAVLLWKSKGADFEVVPSSALTPPADVGESDAHGLRAEYFADVEFKQSIAVILDAGIQHSWNKIVIAPQHASRQEKLAASIRGELNRGLDGLDDAEVRSLIQDHIAPLLAGMSAEEKSSTLVFFTEDERALANIDVATLAKWMPHVCLLDEEILVDLMVAWSESHELPPVKIAPPVAYKPGGYTAVNYSPYRLVGIWMTGPAWPVTEKLIAEHLELTDGTCNALLTYICAWSCRLESSPGVLMKAIAERLDEQSVAADQRATWLMARGRAAELYVGGLPNPFLAMPSLTEARLIAEDPALQFRLQQEHIARIASSGDTEAARAAIDAIDQSQRSANGLAVDELLAGIAAVDEFKARTATEDSPARRAAKAHRMSVLREQQKIALDRGDEAVANLYGRAIEQETAANEQPDAAE